jgi:transposase
MLLFFFPPFIMNKKESLRLRKQVQNCFKKDMPIAKTARRLGVSRPFVYQWKEADNPKEDKRGWTKGRKRKYTDAQEDKVVQKRKEDEEGFFSGRHSSRSS